MKYNEALQAPILEGATKNYRKTQRREIFGQITNAHKQMYRLVNDIFDFVKNHKNTKNKEMRTTFNNFLTNCSRWEFTLDRMAGSTRSKFDRIIDIICLVDNKYGNELKTRFNKILKLYELSDHIRKGYEEFTLRKEDKIEEPSGNTDDELSIAIADNVMVSAYKKGIIKPGYKRLNLAGFQRASNNIKKNFIKMIGQKQYQEFQNRFHAEVIQIVPFKNTPETPRIELLLREFKTKKVKTYFINGYQDICDCFNVSKDAVDKFFKENNQN